jgi:outer membrane protein W
MSTRGRKLMTVKTLKALPLLVGLIGLFAAASAGEVQADERGRLFGLGLHGNYFNTNDADDGTIRAGLQARLRITSGITAELSADYRDEEFEDGDISVEGYPFQLSALWYIFGRGGINPHLIFGGSWYNADVTVRSEGGLTREYSADDFGYHGGFGIELHMTERSFLHADVRYMFIDIDYGGVLDAADTKIDSDGFVVQLGLTFYF